MSNKIEEILNRAEINYNKTIEAQKRKLSDKIYFDFDLVHHFDYSGWCVLNVKSSDLALLSVCLNHIEKYKFINEYHHKKISI